MDILVDILSIVWKVFVGIVIALATMFIIATAFIKFVEFLKGEEGDDYKRK